MIFLLSLFRHAGIFCVKQQRNYDVVTFFFTFELKSIAVLLLFLLMIFAWMLSGTGDRFDWCWCYRRIFR